MRYHLQWNNETGETSRYFWMQRQLVTPTDWDTHIAQVREKNARPVSKWLFFSVAFVRFVCFRQTRVVGGNVFPPRFHWVSNIFSTCIDQETKHPRGRRINLGIILAQTKFFRDQQVFLKISSKSFGLSIHSSHLLFKDYSLEDIVHCIFSRNLQIRKKTSKRPSNGIFETSLRSKIA